MITGAQVVDAARSQMDVPWQHQASLNGVACDCIGLVLICGLILSIPEAAAFKADRRFKGYSRPPNARLLILGCNTYLDRVPFNHVQRGDIVLGRVEIEPQHFGIVSSLEPFRIVHSYAQVGRVTENIIDDRWRDKLLRVYRFRGVS